MTAKQVLAALVVVGVWAFGFLGVRGQGLTQDMVPRDTKTCSQIRNNLEEMLYTTYKGTIPLLMLKEALPGLVDPLMPIVCLQTATHAKWLTETSRAKRQAFPYYNVKDPGDHPPSGMMKMKDPGDRAQGYGNDFLVATATATGEPVDPALTSMMAIVQAAIFNRQRSGWAVQPTPYTQSYDPLTKPRRGRFFGDQLPLGKRKKRSAEERDGDLSADAPHVRHKRANGEEEKKGNNFDLGGFFDRPDHRKSQSAPMFPSFFFPSFLSSFFSPPSSRRGFFQPPRNRGFFSSNFFTSRQRFDPYAPRPNTLYGNAPSYRQSPTSRQAPVYQQPSIPSFNPPPAAPAPVALSPNALLPTPTRVAQLPVTPPPMVQPPAAGPQPGAAPSPAGPQPQSAAVPPPPASQLHSLAASAPANPQPQSVAASPPAMPQFQSMAPPLAGRQFQSIAAPPPAGPQPQSAPLAGPQFPSVAAAAPPATVVQPAGVPLPTAQTSLFQRPVFTPPRGAPGVGNVVFGDRLPSFGSTGTAAKRRVRRASDNNDSSSSSASDVVTLGDFTMPADTFKKLMTPRGASSDDYMPPPPRSRGYYPPSPRPYHPPPPPPYTYYPSPPLSPGLLQGGFPRGRQAYGVTRRSRFLNARQRAMAARRVAYARANLPLYGGARMSPLPMGAAQPMVYGNQPAF